jgi:hypothetical protein
MFISSSLNKDDLVSISLDDDDDDDGDALVVIIIKRTALKSDQYH